MNSRCREFENHMARPLAVHTEEERLDWEEHLTRCPACRSQWKAEVELENLFAETPHPRLSPAFKGKLRERIKREPRPGIHWRSLVMQGYWLAACLATVLILTRTEWSEQVLTGTSLGMLAFLFACFAVPILLLSRNLSASLSDLILTTMEKNGNGVH